MADLNHIALFTQVVEAGSLSGAARRLGIPKATVSRNIARLEADLDTRLLHRTSRRLELTSQGKAYYESVSRGLGFLADAGEMLAAMNEEPSGTLRVTAPVAFGATGLVAMTARFLQRFPKVGIELLLTDEHLDLVAERIDLAFRVGPLKSSSLFARSLGPSRLVVAASPAYIETHGAPETIAEAGDHDWVVFGRSLENASVRLEGPDGVHEVRVRGRLSVDGAYAALLAVHAGLGIGLLPHALVRKSLEGRELHHVLSDYGATGGGFFALYLSNRHPSAAQRAFLDFVSRELRLAPEDGAAPRE